MEGIRPADDNNGDSPQHPWGDPQFVSSPDRFHNLDPIKQSLRSVLLWSMAGMVGSGSDIGSKNVHNVSVLYGNSDRRLSDVILCDDSRKLIAAQTPGIRDERISTSRNGPLSDAMPYQAL